jgi:hypothetical protein
MTVSRRDFLKSAYLEIDQPRRLVFTMFVPHDSTSPIAWRWSSSRRQAAAS